MVATVPCVPGGDHRLRARPYLIVECKIFATDDIFRVLGL
jgi:hypothetical protein